MPLTIVLSVGFDPALLMTRVLVLQSAGYLVEQASSVTKAIDLFQAGDFDLVLLCHSVPRKDRVVPGRSVERCRRRRFVPSLPRDTRYEDASRASQRHEHRGSLARPTHLRRGVS
jgi:CheY-like chemotaxis protein